MIKKTLFIATIIILCLCPVALANDVSYINGDSIVGVKIIPSSYHIEIGQQYTFTVEITNYTGDVLDWVGLDEVDVGSIVGDDSWEVIINPYRTVCFDVTIDVDESIKWYKDGYKYFTKLQPEVCIAVRDDRIYYVQTPKQVILEIDNIEDGSEYLSYEFTDNKKYATYQCQEVWPISGEYKYYGLICNNMVIENISDVKIENINIKGRYGYHTTEDINPSEKKEISAYFEDTTNLYDLPNRVNVQHQLLFKLDNKYYGITASKNYPALYFNVPKIKFELIGKKDDAGNIEKVTLKLTNYSDSHIKNFYIDFSGESRPYLPDNIFPIIKAGETVEIEIPFYNYEWIPNWCDYGFIVMDDNMIIGWQTGYIDYGARYEDTDEYEIWSDYLGNNLHNYEIDALDYIHSEMILYEMQDSASEPTSSPTAEISPSPTENPTSEPTPLATASSQPVYTLAPAATFTPTSIPTDNSSKKTVVTKPYIPIWVWIILISTLLIIIAILDYTYGQYKKHTKNSDDSKTDNK